MATIAVDTYTNQGGKWYINKDPNADLDYSWDWTKYLAGVTDTIATVAFSVTEPGNDTSLTTHNPGFSGPLAVVWLTGGLVGKTYQVTCRITSAHSPARIDDRSIYVKVVQK
jgi:beta-lactamase regulating signal transducer with metallopeptidase domain